jgi:hypothetical protein
MRHQLLAAVVVAAAMGSGPRVRADVIGFSFSGPGLGGSGLLTYGADSVSGDPAGAFAITGISGTFSNTALGFSDVAIVGLVPIAPTPPEDDNPLAPKSFSSMAVTNAPAPHTTISYDNLLYIGGSPITCTGYPGAGGFLDVYGVMFKLSNNYIVDLWSNGTAAVLPPLSYGVAVIDPNGRVVAYQSDGVTAAIPEPGSAVLLGVGLLGLAGWQVRKRRAG